MAKRYQIEHILELADQHGMKDQFHTLIKTAESHGLVPKVFKWTLSFAPPSELAANLFDLSFDPNGNWIVIEVVYRANLKDGPEHQYWQQTMGLDYQTLKAHLGSSFAEVKKSGWHGLEKTISNALDVDHLSGAIANLLG